ncbi:hypothetical protein V1227_16870 [Lentzea sp. DG1S-22]|uniref:hypothetical protein n=1 Tax=Lentzea sp. DG1S-22 TaxID=3108822 RepID=UPI002E797EFF|nr:hypothetical protein [Lentzea sp. DG1S-22]WVH84345.1 hypothetical protein V1227_16870 [Lentzea sp. DG1S-22]
MIGFTFPEIRSMLVGLVLRPTTSIEQRLVLVVPMPTTPTPSPQFGTAKTSSPGNDDRPVRPASHPYFEQGTHYGAVASLSSTSSCGITAKVGTPAWLAGTADATTP